MGCRMGLGVAPDARRHSLVMITFLRHGPASQCCNTAIPAFVVSGSHVTTRVISSKSSEN